MLATERRRPLHAALALLAFVVLAACLLADALPGDRVLVSGESLARSLPWAAALPGTPAHNRFVGDQVRLYWPYLLEAAAVYAGEADALWTSRGGGGQPFLGNMSSALLHPLTWLAAVLPLTRVPLLQALLTLSLSAWFTWLFLRRRGLSPAAASFGALAFGFGGHQVLWLQYALSHTLVALPLCFWATERLVELRSRPRLVTLSAGLALLALGGHPETGVVAALVAGLWALWRLWDHHGRWLVTGAVGLALLLSAVQWLPFLEYASLSTGLKFREVESSRLVGGVSLGASLVFALFLVATLALLRASARGGFSRRLVAVAACVVTLVVARRMGLAVAGSAIVLPQLYGDPVGGGLFTAAQDYPGLNAGYSGVLPPVLLALAGLLGFGGGFQRFYALVALVLWGAAWDLPAVEGLVRAVPGLAEVAPTRLLGPVGFLAACGGASLLDKLASGTERKLIHLPVARLATTLVLVLLATSLVLALPVDPHGGRTILEGLRSPDHRAVHEGSSAIPICLDLDAPAEDLRVLVDGMVLASGPAAATTPDRPLTITLLPQRMEEGRHRLRVEVTRDGRSKDLVDQPLAISRPRRLGARDLLALSASLLVLGWLVARPHPRVAWVAAAVVGLDVLSLGHRYNPATPVERLAPATASTAWLARQEPPFRIFTEGNLLPPDTQFLAGVDHLLSYDNLGFLRTFQLLIEVPIDMDAFASFRFDRHEADYASPMFDLLDVRYVLTERQTDLSDIPGMVAVHESELTIWENTGNLGRAFIVGQAVDMTGRDRDELKSLDPRRVALLEGEVPAILGGSGSARVTAHRASRIEIEVDCDGPALLVVAENRAPGWEASIDGGPFEPTRHAYVAWQALEIPGGRHEVVLRYAPASVAWGAWLSLAGLLIAGVMCALPRRYA